MVYKQVKIKKETDEIIDQCEKSYRFHHPEFNQINLSRNKIIYEIAKYYLRVK